MLKYTVLDSLLGDPASDIFTPSSIGMDIGGAPNWAILLDPQFTQGATYLNRVTGEDMPDIDTAPTVPNIVTVGGAPYARYANGQNPRIRPDAALDPTQLTVFGVVRLQPKTSTNRHTIITSNSANEPYPQLNFGFSGDFTRMVVEQRGGTNPHTNTHIPLQRVVYEPEVGYQDRLVYVMMTFSTQNGLVLYENGAQVAAAPQQTQPFVLSEQPGEYTMLRGLCGDVGLCGVLNYDLSLEAVGTRWRRAIDATVMNYHRILSL